MNSGEKLVNVTRLITLFNVKIEIVPDNLKCAKCRSVLIDAFQMPCGCRFCRVCIDNVITSGGILCPGVSQECRETPLSTALQDYRANKDILKLIATCPHAGCSHMCSLADMESHLPVCPRRSVDCPFRDLGCQQYKFAAEDTRGHFQQESCSHSKILISLITDINRDMRLLKRTDEASEREIENLKHELVLKDDEIRHVKNEITSIKNENESIKKDTNSIIEENKSIKERDKSITTEIKLIKDENKSIKDENKLIKNENISIRKVIESIKEENKLIKDENKSIKDENKSIKDENKSIKDENKSIKDENKSIKDENKSMKIDIKSIQVENKSMKDEIKLIIDKNKSIKRDQEVLSDLVSILSEKLEWVIDEKHNTHEEDSTKITESKGLNLDDPDTEIKSVRDDISSIDRDIQSISGDINSLKVQSIQVPREPRQVDASCNEWLVNHDVSRTEWGRDIPEKSDYFTGTRYPYKYRLTSMNRVRRNGLLWVQLRRGELDIRLRILTGPSDALLDWPFNGVVTVTVADRTRREVCSRLTQQCRIEKPPNKKYRNSDEFVFWHSELKAAGLNLSRGVCVSCQVVPDSYL